MLVLMLAIPHPEVLSVDWLPPTLPARGGALAEVERILAGERLPGRARLLAVEGPEGSGTSVVARRGVRAWMDRHYGRGERFDGRVLTVRARSCRGTVAVAGTLLRHFDPAFEPRGFPAMEILAGSLRRIRREGRPAAVILDDLDADTPALAPIVRGLASPVRFLPEGDEGFPPLTVVLAGASSAIQRIRRKAGFSIPGVVLPPYRLAELEVIVRERIARALGREPPASMAEQLARQAFEEGRGAARALDLVRRALIGWNAARAHSVYTPLGRERGLWVEDHLVGAIARACRAGVPTLGVVRACEQTLAREKGVTSLPTTTFWRRIVRLEQAGYIRREVRTGGAGGSQSRVHLQIPVNEWVTYPRATGTPRGSFPVFGGPPAEGEAASALPG